MYRVSPFVRLYAYALLGGAAMATLWVNLDPASYYDIVELRLFDLPLPHWLAQMPLSLTPHGLVSQGLMAFFIFFVGKELWEALTLERGTLNGGSVVVPFGGVIGGMIGSVLGWLLCQSLFETASEAGFGAGWPVPLGGDVVLCYLVGRIVFGSGHVALHVLLLITIGADILGLLLLGLANPDGLLRLSWLLLPLAASLGAWYFLGRSPGANPSERRRRQGLALWPYIIAAALCFVGVAAAGLPPALGLLPIIPAVPHAARTFGLFAEAEVFLHDPLNRLAHALARPLALVLLLFGFTKGGVDLAALGPSTGAVLVAYWLGKPAGIFAGMAAAAALTRTTLPPGVGLRDVVLIATISGIGFTIPILAIDSALPGGRMAEAARLGLALSLFAAPAALFLGRILPRGTR